MSNIKLVIVGLASYHTKHILALKSNTNIEVVGVCDINSNAAKEISEKFSNVPCYSDFRDAISSLKPDAVFISLPHDQYFKVVKFALENNIHIFKEKPFARDLEEAKKIVELLEKSSSKVMIVSQRRFHKTYFEANNLLNCLGQVKFVFATYCFNKPTSSWRKNKQRSGGGVIIDSGYHFIDLLLYYFGLPEAVKCKLSKLSDDPLCETEDFAAIEFQYSHKGTIQLILNRLSEAKKEEIVIYGELGKLVVTKNEIELDLFDSGISKKITIETDDFTEAYRQQYLSFFTSLSAKYPVCPSVKEGILNSLVIEACYLSANKNASLVNIKDLIVLKGVNQ